MPVTKTQAILGRQCSRCVLDESVPDLTILPNGQCNYCQRYDEIVKQYFQDGKERAHQLERILQAIRSGGKRKRYDCIAGVSGGADSSYVVYLAKQFGLRPLLVHFDNGWNTELATQNIEKIVQKTGFDLFTYVVNWPEFRDLQLSYLKASVVDIEVPTDHLIFATLHKLAAQYGIRYILNGFNVNSEFIMPKGWNYPKEDAINLKAIHKRFGTVELKKFPSIGFFSRLYYRQMLEIQNVLLLDLVNYRLRDAEKILEREFAWQSPGSKHGESVFTRFYQSYILPEKFGIDKRKAHFSNLICSGQMSREEAIAKLQGPILPKDLVAEDRAFFLKKLGLSELEFSRIMKTPVCSHEEFDSETHQAKRLVRIAKTLAPFTKVVRVLRRMREAL